MISGDDYSIILPIPLLSLYLLNNASLRINSRKDERKSWGIGEECQENAAPFRSPQLAPHFLEPIETLFDSLPCLFSR